MPKSDINTPDLSGIATRLRKLMHQKGINQNELSKQLDITIQTLSAIVNSKSLLSTETLIKAAQYFNVSTDYILTGEAAELTSDLLYRHKEISEQLSNKIKDAEIQYKGTEINNMIKAIPTKRTTILDLVKIAITIETGSDEPTIHNMINEVDEETYELLKKLNSEFIKSHNKK